MGEENNGNRPAYTKRPLSRPFRVSSASGSHEALAKPGGVENVEKQRVEEVIWKWG
jgi:hypothetical protein